MTKNRNRSDSEESPSRLNTLVIGGGPAGLSAALWCFELGLETAVVDRGAEFGGQLLKIHNPVRNYLGIEAPDGTAIRDLFLASVSKSRFQRFLDTKVSSVDVSDRTARLGSGKMIIAESIIVATGVRRRKLGIEGEEEFRGKGVLESGAKERSSVAGKRVVIVGGGDAALENALILGETASKVTVVHRRADFTARSEFLTPAKENPKVELLPNTKVLRIGGGDAVGYAEISNIASGRASRIPADSVLIRIGVEPNSDFVRGKLGLDERGYILVDRDCRTTAEGIFAAGDVANPTAPTISSAVGSGATAAKAAFNWVNRRI